MSLPPQQYGVLGLRFYSCSQCDTVHAEPTDPSTCPTCDAAGLKEITDCLQDDTYFWTRGKR
jgi:DnaJ-class molecular chaperone